MVIKDIETFRNLEKMNYANDGNRSLIESIVVPEIGLALTDWSENHKQDYVLIGGLALSYYVKPRMTTDVDVLFLNFDNIPKDVSKFKKHRPHAFQHNSTHVEIETVTPESINVPFDVVKSVFDTSIIKDGIRIASPSGLVALKLFRFNRQDQADIENLINCTKIDLTTFNLPSNLLEKYNEIKN